jgi:hypothetical protein
LSRRNSFLDFNPELRTRKDFHADADGENFVLETTQDVEMILESNRSSRAVYGERQRHDSEVLNRYASIPLTIYMDLLKQGITEDEQRMKAWLNDPANAHWRTRYGRV